MAEKKEGFERINVTILETHELTLGNAMAEYDKVKSLFFKQLMVAENMQKTIEEQLAKINELTE